MATPEEIAANKALVIRYMTASQQNDHATMADCLAEDAVRVFPRPGLRPDPFTRGRDQIISNRPLTAIYEQGTLKSEFLHLVGEGPMVAVHFSMTAKTTDGRPYENFYHMLFEVHDGRITQYWEHCDTLYGAMMLRPEAIKQVAASL